MNGSRLLLALPRLLHAHECVERDRKLDVGCFVRALVLAGGTPGAGLQADALHAYLDMRVPDISRAAFYKRFGPSLEALMARLSERAMA